MLTLETKKQTINLVFKTRKLVDISNKAQGRNFEECFFKAMNDLDLDGLSKIIYSLAENEENKNPFKTSSEVYDFIDDYKEENSKSYMDIFKEIAEAVNNEGFFNNKMSKEELEEKISNPLLQMNLEDITKKSVEKAVSEIASQQITATIA